MTAILQRVTQVRRGEAAAVVASALCFFFILTALMVLRPAREALVESDARRSALGSRPNDARTLAREILSMTQEEFSRTF